MSIITSSEELKDFCQDLTDAPFVTVDTEFLRERTYYPKLCLIQISAPNIEAIAIDPIAAPNIDLSPLEAIFKNQNILKVMHAGRQDMEIFHKLFGYLPTPYFDTQIAAMVCGYGEQVGYEALVRSVMDIDVDKSKQYTDWSLRPLSQAQINYALNDVIYLKDVYIHLDKELKKTGREKWVVEEMAALLDIELYDPPLQDLWRRIRIKTNKPHKLAVLQDLAIWREEFARKKDLPRSHIMKDETIAEIALQSPTNVKSLARIRGVSDRFAEGDKGSILIKIVQKAIEKDIKDCPQKDIKEPVPQHLMPTLEMLKMLLRIQASEHNVAAKLIAKSEDLETLAIGKDQSLAVLKGWRHEIFGQKALALKDGKIAFSLKKGQIHISEI